MNRVVRWLFTVAAFLAIESVASADTILSTGYVVPETISQAPAGFGQYGGSFFIPDAGTSQIMVMPAGGGAPSVFQTVDSQNIRGGLFLPAGFGPLGGQFIVVGRSTDTFTGQITAYDAGGNATLFGSSSTSPGFIDPAIAPDGFGAFGGELFVSDGSGLSLFDGSGNFSPFVPNLGLVGNNASFGVTFAPAGFGSVGGTVLVDNAGQVNGQSEILSVDAGGNVTPFVTLDLTPGQIGLRQMAFAPDDFGIYGGSLFISVSGSTNGGGALGSVLALNSAGQVIATLKVGTATDKFDPRGLTFLPGGQLLIADTSDPILLAGPSDFQRVPVPEPDSAFTLMLCSLIFLMGVEWRRKRVIAG